MPSVYCAQLTRDLLAIAKFLFIVLFATYSVNVNFRDYSNYVDRMNPLFPCDHEAATHSCIMHDTGCGIFIIRYVSYGYSLWYDVILLTTTVR